MELWRHGDRRVTMGRMRVMGLPGQNRGLCFGRDGIFPSAA